MEFSFNISVTPKCAILHFKGSIISQDIISEVIDQAGEVISKGTVNLICDLAGVDYCNSTGLNLFIRLLTKARNFGGDCVLVAMQPKVSMLFELSKLNTIFTSYISLEEAEARFNTTA